MDLLRRKYGIPAQGLFTTPLTILQFVDYIPAHFIAHIYNRGLYLISIYASAQSNDS